MYNMNTLIKNGGADDKSHKTVVKVVTLTFDSKVISVNSTTYYQLHSSGRHCPKYEHPKSKKNEAFELQAVISYDTDL